MSDKYICISEHKKAKIGTVFTTYHKDYNNKGVAYNIYATDSSCSYEISGITLNKKFLPLEPKYSVNFQVKNMFGFNKTIKYNMEFKNINENCLRMVYKKVFSYIRRVELMDSLIINNFKNVIMDICNNLMLIYKLEENHDEDFKPFLTAVSDAEEVFASMYNTALDISKKAKGGEREIDIILNENKKVINLYSEMFKDLNKI